MLKKDNLFLHSNRLFKVYFFSSLLSEILVLLKLNSNPGTYFSSPLLLLTSILIWHWTIKPLFIKMRFFEEHNTNKITID